MGGTNEHVTMEVSFVTEEGEILKLETIYFSILDLDGKMDGTERGWLYDTAKYVVEQDHMLTITEGSDDTGSYVLAETLEGTRSVSDPTLNSDNLTDKQKAVSIVGVWNDVSSFKVKFQSTAGRREIYFGGVDYAMLEAPCYTCQSAGACGDSYESYANPDFTCSDGVTNTCDTECICSSTEKAVGESNMVTCTMTIDNSLTHISYNGEPLSASGNPDKWQKVKSFSFVPVNGAYLEIGGYEERDDCNGCECSGLLLECDNGLISSTSDWEAVGSSSEIVDPSSGYGSVCESSSTFSLEGQTSDAQKIWPSGGEKYAWFRAIPVKEPVTCTMTLDNVLTHISYNGESLSTSGDWSSWKSVKTFSFVPVSGAYLEIGGYESDSCNGCKCSGLLLECDSGFISSTSDWEAVGSSSELVGASSGYGSLCESSSSFSLKGQTSDAQKIWPSGGEKYAWFRAIPVGEAMPGSTETVGKSLQLYSLLTGLQSGGYMNIVMLFALVGAISTAHRAYKGLQKAFFEPKEYQVIDRGVEHEI